MPEFDADAIRRIRDVVIRVEQYPRDEVMRGVGPRIVPYSKLAISTTTITGRSSKTPGSGTVQPYLYDQPSNTLKIFGSTFTVLNWTGSAVASSKWVKYVFIDGYAWIDGNDCSGVAP